MKTVGKSGKCKSKYNNLKLTGGRKKDNSYFCYYKGKKAEITQLRRRIKKNRTRVKWKEVKKTVEYRCYSDTPMVVTGKHKFKCD